MNINHFFKFAATIIATISMALITACSTIPSAKGTASEPAALKLLAESQQAHGKAAFEKINDLNVSYDGTWFEIVTRIQPVLTDKTFRKTSQERTLFRESFIAQQHSGDAGTKTIIKDGSRMFVANNGTVNNNPATIAASNLVLEAYQLFLYPAFYVQRASWVETAGTDSVNGFDCDLLLAVMRPGIGNATEDRVLLYIDQKEKLVRRVRLTLEGTETTKGAVVDVDFNQFVEIAGVKWPSKFYEALVSPFRGLPAHDFWLTGLDINRGLTKADFANGKFSDAAKKPASKIITSGS